MILWILRRFAQFRHLEALEVRYRTQEGVIRHLRRQGEHKDEQIEGLTAQVSTSNTTARELIGLLNEARASEIKSTQTVADFVSQMKYGRKIYDHVPELPDLTPVPEPERVGRKQAFDLVRDAERKFAEQMANKHLQDAGTTTAPSSYSHNQ